MKHTKSNYLLSIFKSLSAALLLNQVCLANEGPLCVKFTGHSTNDHYTCHMIGVNHDGPQYIYTPYNQPNYSIEGAEISAEAQSNALSSFSEETITSIQIRAQNLRNSIRSTEANLRNLTNANSYTRIPDSFFRSLLSWDGFTVAPRIPEPNIRPYDNASADPSNIPHHEFPYGELVGLKFNYHPDALTFDMSRTSEYNPNYCLSNSLCSSMQELQYSINSRFYNIYLSRTSPSILDSSFASSEQLLRITRLDLPILFDFINEKLEGFTFVYQVPTAQVEPDEQLIALRERFSEFAQRYSQARNKLHRANIIRETVSQLQESQMLNNTDADYWTRHAPLQNNSISVAENARFIADHIYALKLESRGFRPRSTENTLFYIHMKLQSRNRN